ncbi:MAG: LicD family protein [Firmicutes bacterium]|nr:LicD family protein [Bacillota bacterium]
MDELSLQQVQQGSLLVLKKIIEICGQEQLRFSLMYGTLIGAVRHQGFIPWDDDIDIMMPRPDYERFVQYCIDNSESLGCFALMHYRTNKRYIYGIARFCDTRYRIEYQDAKDYGLGLFVDIYPLDGINVSDRKQLRELSLMQKIICNCGWSHYIAHKGIVKTVCKLPLYLYSRVTSVSKWLERLDTLAQKYRYDDMEYIYCTAWGTDPYRHYMRADVMDDLIWVPFEDTRAPIIRQYDEILRMYYNDYMLLPPESERVGHHYYKAYRK